jgi:aminoglycoside 2'-N-acetyltransferase I
VGIESGGERRGLELRVVQSDSLSPGLRAEILALCQAAYEQDLAWLFATFEAAKHVLGYVGEALVSHALWVSRMLQVGDGPALKAAYVELVATRKPDRRRGFASRVMRRLAQEIPDTYDVAALCPADPEFYVPLGWRLWRGPLSIRLPTGELQATPDERVMVLELPGRRSLDLDAPLSAEWRPGELW